MVGVTSPPHLVAKNLEMLARETGLDTHDTEHKFTPALKATNSRRNKHNRKRPSPLAQGSAVAAARRGVFLRSASGQRRLVLGRSVAAIFACGGWVAFCAAPSLSRRASMPVARVPGSLGPGVRAGLGPCDPPGPSPLAPKLATALGSAARRPGELAKLHRGRQGSHCRPWTPASPFSLTRSQGRSPGGAPMGFRGRSR